MNLDNSNNMDKLFEEIKSSITNGDFEYSVTELEDDYKGYKLYENIHSRPYLRLIKYLSLVFLPITVIIIIELNTGISFGNIPWLGFWGFGIIAMYFGEQIRSKNGKIKFEKIVQQFKKFKNSKSIN
jgi:hypothetical protein